ncbi:MAG: efflux RND transporter permease subunit, partial [Candidatus Glassbacteria bacterium]|nr:efflux RND transporter permease subunit [Candidatus Glassbacteria bacterium]
MKKIIQFAVDYPITVLMLVLAVLLLGYISFRRLGMDLFPELNNPRIYVELKAGERPPEEIEKQFVRNIEAQAIQQKNTVQVSSVSRVGSAQVTVEYAWGTSMDEAFLVLQKSLNEIQQDSDIDELTISQIDPNAAPIILLSFSHPGITDMDELRKVAESYVRNELIRLEGIAEVRLLGQEEKEVVVETSPYLLEAFGLTPGAVAQSIRGYNSNISGGTIEEMGTNYIIKGIGEFASLEEIGQVIVALKDPESFPGQEAATVSSSGKVPVFLKDVAEIRLLNKKPDNIVRVNGQRCMGLAVYKETRYNTVKAVSEFMKSLETLKKALPGYELSVIQNKGEFISLAIDEVEQTALVGILLAVAVLFIFLRRFGVTLIISVAIPISIVATFNLMYFNGLTLNIMTLGGLALGAGMLVDNAIIVMENIFRNLEQGLPLKEASVLGTSQVGGAITASTITTIVVFLPIVYLHGAAGELFKDQAWTVAFSLLSSLGVAILVIPMLSRRLLGKAPSPQRTPADEGMAVRSGSIRFPRYGRFLRRVLEVKWTVILLAAALVAASLALLPYVGSEFIPKTGLSDFTVELTLPEGTELYRTEGTVAGVEEGIGGLLGEDIGTIYSITGPSRQAAGSLSAVYEDENTAVIKVILKKGSNLPAAEVFARLSSLLAEVPDLEARIYQEQTVSELTLGTETDPVVVEVQGEDLERLQALTLEARQRALACGDLFNVETS